MLMKFKEAEQRLLARAVPIDKDGNVAVKELLQLTKLDPTFADELEAYLAPNRQERKARELFLELSELLYQFQSNMKAMSREHYYAVRISDLSIEDLKNNRIIELRELIVSVKRKIIKAGQQSIANN